MKLKFALIVAVLSAASLYAQQRGAAPAAAPPTPRVQAPIDVAGYWVAIVSEDWRWRMGVGLKGDYGYLTLSPEGKKAGDSWDPAKDEGAGEQCKTYGAVGVMRLPTRLHITWDNDDTMKVETDAGTQTRLFHFTGAAPQGQIPSWQGYSAARWEAEGPRGARGAPQAAPRAGQLRVMTTNLRAGYIYKHGVPYSGNARLTEFFEINPGLQGETYLSVTATVDDPQYWAQPFVRTVHFRKEADGSKWSPSACSSR